MMIITHDISVVAEVGERIGVMYAGKLFEYGSIQEIFEKPANPYTIGLLSAFPSIKGPRRKLRSIPGSPPDLSNPPSGCRFPPRCQFAHAGDGIPLEIRRGEILGVVGESGCGKTTTGRLLVRLENPTEGSMMFRGEDVAKLRGDALKRFRGRVQMIFQEPYESLNPRFTVFQTVSEPLIVHNVGETFAEREGMVAKALESSAHRAPAGVQR